VRRTYANSLIGCAWTILTAALGPSTVLGQETVTAEQQEARKREVDAEEDPLKKRQAGKVDRPDEWSDKPSGVDLYGSARLRYRKAGDETVLEDGGSRIGVSATWQYRPQSWLFGRVEAGFNVLNALEAVFQPGSRENDSSDAALFPRLYYAGLETPDFIASFGKNWSTYYQVTGFTDLFDSTGGSASGTYNAQTDGGPSGTGRADSVLQTRLTVDWFPESLNLKPFDMNVQLQYDRKIPNVEGGRYGVALGMSSVFKTQGDTEVGFAYNYADVRDESAPAVVASGIKGDDHAFAIAARRISDRWYLASTVARLRNHETTDQKRYVDAWGWELYGRYRLVGKLWAVGGWNWLKPDRGQPLAGQYRVKYGVLGLRFSIKEFRRLIYLEVRLDESRDVDGTPIGDSAAFGIRWDFD
jgi:predicted porin